MSNAQGMIGGFLCSYFHIPGSCDYCEASRPGEAY